MGSSDLVRCRHRRGLRGCCIMRGDLALDLSDIGEGAVPSQLQFRRDQAVLRIGSVILPEGAVGSVAGSFKIAADGTLDLVAAAGRSDERRVGKECVSTCRSRWWPYH